MTRRHRAPWWTLSLLAAGCVEGSRGCEPGWHSEGDQIAFYEPTVIVGAEGYFSNEGPLLVGTVICPRIDCVRPEIEDEDNPPLDLCPANPDESKTNSALLACFAMELEGLATLSGTCVTFTDAGSVAWNFTPDGCEAQAMGYAPEPDSARFRVVDPDDLVAWFRPDADLAALENLEPAPGRSFPEDAVRGRGDVVKLLAGQTVRLPIVLEGPEGDVGWQVRRPTEFGAVTVASVSVQPLVGEAPTVTLTDEGAVVTTIAEGARASLELVTPVADFQLGEIEGVAASEIRSLELAVGFAPADTEQPATPAGARAILRDGTGAPVYGGRIDWEVVEGRLGLGRSRLSIDGQPDPEQPDCEYMALAGDCYEQPYRDYEVRATLAARFGDLEDEVEIEWTIVPGDVAFYDQFATLFGAGGDAGVGETTYPCEGPGAVGCECSAGDGPDPAAWTGLLMLPVTVRRRRGKRPGAMR